MMCRLLLLVSVISCLVCDSRGLSRVDPLVKTQLGMFRGLAAPDDGYDMFLGIPYALVDPLNPFGVSMLHPGFTDTFDAIDDSAICPQVEYFTNEIAGTLDCLRLNVYVPNSANADNRLAVMVWFHGGAFSTGFAGRNFYGPKFLVKNDIILVTVNYRLGPYGFFCLNTPEVPGNQGLKDQILALKWVNSNIEAFGGDINSITIFGESAGGSSVNHHLIYGKDKLFNKAIIQSVPAISPFSLKESDSNAPLKISEHLDYATRNLQDALNFLKGVHPDLIISVVSELGLQFRPCVEQKFHDVEHFITDYPINVKVPKKNIVPILIGFTNNEALFSHGNLPLENFNSIMYETLNTSFNFNDKQLETMVDIVRKFYIGEKDLREEDRQVVIDFISDVRYVYPIHKTINSIVGEGASFLYQYVFSYEGERNFFKARSNITAPGAAHTDELSYLFEIAVLNETVTPEDQVLIDRMTTLWTNFAKTSNPTPEATELLPTKWPAVTEDALYYLDIGSELLVKKRPFFKRMAFWDLFYRINEEFQIGYRQTKNTPTDWLI